jgi:ssDNA-binding Zn-finger/Zn-ribbon topoisomerase 1
MAASCKICRKKSDDLSERGLCPRCEELAEIARRNLEGAARSKLKPPKRRQKCPDCGVPMVPVLFRPEGPWTFYCDNGLSCRWCVSCGKVHKFNELCPRPEPGLSKRVQ